MVKVTFTLDDETVAELRRTAERLRLPQSRVVREAVADFAARADRLSDRERLRVLNILKGLQTEPPTRPAKDADAELREIRRSRRAGGRRSAR